MAASMSPSYRSMGCSVRVDAISGDRQHSKKSCFPFASWYSGRYLPAVYARSREEGVSQFSCNRVRVRETGTVCMEVLRCTPLDATAGQRGNREVQRGSSERRIPCRITHIGGLSTFSPRGISFSAFDSLMSWQACMTHLARLEEVDHSSAARKSPSSLPYLSEVTGSVVELGCRSVKVAQESRGGEISQKVTLPEVSSTPVISRDFPRAVAQDEAAYPVHKAVHLCQFAHVIHLMNLLEWVLFFPSLLFSTKLLIF